jgi:hypothetical protein
MAWTGLALCQQPPSAPQPGERLLTLKEKGGKALRCRVIANWTMPEGGKAFQVQDVESGEMITISETGANKAKRIVHWGKNTTPPPGVPVPPPPETVRAEAPIVVTPKAEMPRVEAPKIEAPPATPIIINGSAKARITESAALPVIINAPPPSVVPPQVICAAPTPAPNPLDAHVPEPVQTLVTERPASVKVVSAPPVIPPQEFKVPAQVVETKPPAEWRESWGTTASAPGAAPPLVPPPSMGRPDPQTTPGFFAKVDPRQALQEQSQPAPLPIGQPLDGRVQRVPAGMQSVMSAGDPVQYMPIPIMTQPPVTQMPQAPSPVRQKPGMPAMPPQEQFVNAFTPPQQDLPPMPMAGYGMYPRGVMATGYVPPMIRNPYPPYAMNGPMVPMGYPGPMPTPAYNPAARPSMPVLPPVAVSHFEQQMAVLKDALYPSHREMAAMQLAGYSTQYFPHVVQALVTAAKGDPAATVRAACVGALVKLRANTPEVIGVLHQLRNDGDPRVRQEVDQAFVQFAPGLAPHEQPHLQPAQATQRPLP